MFGQHRVGAAGFGAGETRRAALEEEGLGICLGHLLQILVAECLALVTHLRRGAVGPAEGSADF